VHFIKKKVIEKREDFDKKLLSKKILRVPGAYNPLTAKLIEEIGYDGVYVSGGVMSNDLGYPDIGLTKLKDVSYRANQIARVTNLPTIVDADTGFKSCEETVNTFEKLGLTGLHIEDQISQKRCGHLDNKELISKEEMVKKIKLSVKSRKEKNFKIIARTDANSIEGIDKTIEIVIVPKLADITANQKNVGIVLDEKLILKILSKRYRNVSITEINTENDLKKLALRKPDLVFSGVKYFYFDGGIIWLNDYLELYDISYIASNREALHNEHDKSIAKKIMQKANIKTADFFTTEPGEHQNEMSIPIAFPLFIKPLTGGDSRGVDANSIVYDFLSFQAKVLDIKRKHNLRSLVETYLSGKEYSVSILQDNSNGNLKAMPIEIVVDKNINGHCILDYDIKKMIKKR